MSEQTYQPPYPPAEKVVTYAGAKSMTGRSFLIQEKEGKEYWLAPSCRITKDRDMAYVYSPEEIPENASGGRQEFELLPVLRAEVPPTERVGTIEEVGTMNSARRWIMKRDGKYCINGPTGRLSEDRNEAKVWSPLALWKLHEEEPDKLKHATFELLVPLGALTGGPETEKEITLEEAGKLPKSSRFLVRTKVADQHGFYYLMADWSSARRDMACKYRPIEVDSIKASIETWDEGYKDIIVELLKPCKVSAITDFFNESSLELLKAAPNNPMIRSFVLSKVKVAPPKEADDYDKLKEWIEWNVSSESEPSVNFGSLITPEPPQPARPTGPVLEVVFNMEQVEYGRCSYQRRTEGRQTLRVTRELINGIMEDDEPEDLEALSRELLQSAYNDIDYDALEAVDGSEDYEDYEANDGGDAVGLSFRQNQRDRNEALKAFLLQHMPETAIVLGLTTTEQPAEAA